MNLCLSIFIHKRFLDLGLEIFLMLNVKHTAIAVASIAIIGSLAVNQLGEFVSRPVDAELLSHRSSNVITVSNDTQEEAETDAEITNNENSAAENSDTASQNDAKIEKESSDITKNMTEEELTELIAKKSELQTGYVLLTSGTLSVKAEPSSESSTVDILECKTQIKILSTSEGWSRIQYDGGKQGYAPVSAITDSKEEAEFAAKHYDNYMKAKVTPTTASAVRIRKGPSTSSEIVGELQSGSTVLLLWNEKDFVKVIYGDSYQEGYMIASALTMSYEWVAKSEVEQKRAEIKKKAEEEAARKKAEEAAKKKAAEDAKKKAEAAAQKKAAKSTSKAPAAVSNAPASSKGQAIVNEAKKYLGIKYVYGGSTPKGFDCSGLVKYVFAKNGISVSRTSAAQSKQGVTVSKSNLQPGDLLFFAKNGRVHHVGIYAGNGQMIHAPHTGARVRYDSINTAYRQREFYCAKRMY